MQVILPTIEKFLLLYSLRCGSIIVLLWTSLRSFLCLVFFIIALLEVFALRHFPFGALLVDTSSKKLKPINEENIYYVYAAYISLLVSESFLFFHLIYVAVGLYTEKSRLFEPYLICRFVTWLFETIFLFTLCLIHKLLIGWYLAMLFFVVLEFYSFIVIYSYYNYLLGYESFVCNKIQIPNVSCEL